MSSRRALAKIAIAAFVAGAIVTIARRAVAERQLATLSALPSAITFGGYALSLAWLTGGPAWMGIAGIAADELDGRVARATGQTSEYGSLLDWSVDLSMTALTLGRLGALWALPVVTAAQVYLRDAEWRPTFGSARAALMLYAIGAGR